MAKICAFANIAKHANEGRKALAMSDKPLTTYIGSVFDKPHWRTILSTNDEGEPEAMLQDGDKVRVYEITPKPKKR